MKKEIENFFKKKPVRDEANKSSFDWLLFIFLTVIIILLVTVFAK